MEYSGQLASANERRVEVADPEITDCISAISATFYTRHQSTLHHHRWACPCCTIQSAIHQIASSMD